MSKEIFERIKSEFDESIKPKQVATPKPVRADRKQARRAGRIQAQWQERADLAKISDIDRAILGIASMIHKYIDLAEVGSGDIHTPLIATDVLERPDGAQTAKSMIGVALGLNLEAGARGDVINGSFNSLHIDARFANVHYLGGYIFKLPFDDSQEPGSPISNPEGGLEISRIILDPRVSLDFARRGGDYRYDSHRKIVRTFSRDSSVYLGRIDDLNAIVDAVVDVAPGQRELVDDTLIPKE